MREIDQKLSEHMGVDVAMTGWNSVAFSTKTHQLGKTIVLLNKHHVGFRKLSAHRQF